MKRYAALLRAVNLGSRQRVAMAELRDVLTGIGHGDVSTYLQSGNALFTAEEDDPDKLAARIETAVAGRFGAPIRCLVRDHEELRRVVAGNPLADVATEPARYLVTFLSEPPDPARLAAIDPEPYLPDRFVAGERELYTWYPNGVGTSKLTNSFYEKRLAVAVATARNWNTVTKLVALTAAA